MRKTYILVAAAAMLLAASCSQDDGLKTDIIPYPQSLETRGGAFSVAGADFYCTEGMDTRSILLVQEFTERLSNISGKPGTLGTGSGRGFVFTTDPALPDEAYTIDIRRHKATVSASSYNGFLYAIETIRQMLPVSIYGEAPAPEDDWRLPCVTIKDSPRFGYRGMHLDVARHFFSTAEVKKVIDIMSIHKLNRLHWHLTDDQGWRIEIKKHPRLTEVGSIRKGTVIKKDWDRYDGIPYGGFYTQEEIKDVIEYAAGKGITIIPEIDLPGHMLAALTAYPSLGCTGGPYDVWGRWGVADEVLCAGKEKTMLFLEDVLSEVSDLFPAEYIHIGGDECPKVRWEKCPVCQAKIKELGLKDDEEYTAEHYLQSYVMERMENFLAGKGKRIIGWDEILEGAPGPQATIMSWRGSDGGIKASGMGHDVIMTPNSHFYFDYYQAEDTDNEPFGIGGYVPIEKVYSYEPFTEEMDDEARSHILGVQANLWTEYIKTASHLEYMILPRLAALSEVQWCNPENKDWDRFLASLSHEAAIYDIMGYNYAKTVFQIISKVSVNPEKGCVEVALSTQGDAPIRYTTDGSEPDTDAALYTAPVEIRKGCTVKARVERDNMEIRTYSQDFIDNKAMGKKAVLNTLPMPKYSYSAPDNFVDGIRGVFQYSSGQWAGWNGDPFSVTIDMGSGISYSSVTLGTMSIKDEDVFPPLSLTVSTSEDGKEFTEAGSISIPMIAVDDKDSLKEYTVEFPQTSARYVKVDAETVSTLPSWHGRAGQKGFLFVDEIVVR